MTASLPTPPESMAEASGLEALAAALGTTVGDAQRWRQALTHPSYVHEHPDEGPSYERLEFLGDALLGAAVAEHLWRARPDAPEGHLSFLRSVLVRREALAAWVESLPVAGVLRLGAGAAQLSGAGRDTILADVAEALLAAVYLDHGWTAVLDAVAAGPAAEIPDYASARRELEPKSVLQEALAAAGREVPRYEPVDRDGERVTVAVTWDGGSARGRGRNRREAEAEAARRALDTMDRRDAS